MTSSKKTARTCKNGHLYYKSSDCLVCPICEKERVVKEEFLSILSAPARRALENAGLNNLYLLSQKTETEILKLHGVGPGSIPKLKVALKSKRLCFRKQ